ncbi:MAG: UDP-N-acetylglucosamine 2-epimerase, partial [Pseudomonadota bacterium]|nr:UDP-N-acetylglucosamine 2-epimerase [Pseudomonadota bacterium]
MKIKKKKNIFFFTANRAEYGLQLSVMQALKKSDIVDYFLLISGNHLDKRFGKTISEIIEDDHKNIIKINSYNRYSHPAQMAISVSKIISKITKLIDKLEPEVLVVHGDRSEALAATIAAHENNIAIAHLEGGDATSGGTHDDNIRHAITKLAHLHFPTNNISYKRLLLLGEEKWRVKMYGFTGLDLIKKKDFSKEAEIVKKYKLHKKQPILICTFHPLSSNITETKKETECSFRALKKILKEHDLKCIITYPNNDAGSNFILEKIKKLESIFNNVKLFKSLGRKDYWGLLNLNKSKYRIICIGNSSSGIKESSAFNCPTVNIGVRQEGRIAGKNVIQAKADENDIYTSIMKC